MSVNQVKLGEKIGYALGDGAANIAWRGVATFLFIFYTDVFGLNPAAVGLLLLVARVSDGITDVLMGIIGDRTESKYGKFRPWVLWTAIPLGVILSFLFTAPNLSYTGKIIYAYTTYIVFTLVYTANNIPYGALMAVMTGNDKERTSIGSFRMVGAFAGGMIVQGALLFLVSYYGDVDPQLTINRLDDKKYELVVSANHDVENASINTENGIALFSWASETSNTEKEPASATKSFRLEANKNYVFLVEGEANLTPESFSVINQKKGYSYSIYLMSIFLSLIMLVTFYTTKERVRPLETQTTNLRQDLKDLITNKPWFVLLVIGLLFNVYNSIKQGITVIYFTHYLHNQLLAGSYLVMLMVASIAGAMSTIYLGNKFGKRNLFIYALIFSGTVNALLYFCGTNDIFAIFTLGIISEFASAIFPTLFFAMLGDAADFSEFKNGRRATGLIYSAGSFATKFGGGVAGAIIGLVLASFQYNGQDSASIANAIPGIKMLMSWIPTLIAILAAILMTLYPLTQKKLDEITMELNNRRAKLA